MFKPVLREAQLKHDDDNGKSRASTIFALWFLVSTNRKRWKRDRSVRSIGLLALDGAAANAGRELQIQYCVRETALFLFQRW